MVSFVADCSIETTPHVSKDLSILPRYLAEGTSVYVAHPPNTKLEDVVSMAAELRELGYAPVPHIAARKIRTESELDDALGRMREIGIDRVLVIAGDLSPPVGPFGSTLELLQTGLTERHLFRSVGIAGHPEGSRVVSDTELRRALVQKAEYAASTAVSMHIVTQFGFNALAVLDWEAALRREGIGLPVHVGMAGKATPQQLLRFAALCGISKSMRMLVNKASTLSHLRLATVDELVVDFAVHKLSHPDCRIVRAHFYAFGGAERTLQWLQQIRSGSFHLSGDRRRIEFD